MDLPSSFMSLSHHSPCLCVENAHDLSRFAALGRHGSQAAGWGRTVRVWGCTPGNQLRLLRCSAICASHLSVSRYILSRTLQAVV